MLESLTSLLEGRTQVPNMLSVQLAWIKHSINNLDILCVKNSLNVILKLKKIPNNYISNDIMWGMWSYRKNIILDLWLNSKKIKRRIKLYYELGIRLFHELEYVNMFDILNRDKFTIPLFFYLMTFISLQFFFIKKKKNTI